jgi:LuxR family transcriptional regulator, maltose regulon positive regulatory protein
MQNIPASSGGKEGLTGDRLLLVTKLAMPPVRSDLVARPRLTNQLSLGVHRPLTLIAAPAGFGKTTLLATWLERASLQSAWLSLEQDDNDLTRFWSYVFTALKRVNPDSGESALALLQGSGSQQPSPIETVLYRASP